MIYKGHCVTFVYKTSKQYFAMKTDNNTLYVCLIGWNYIGIKDTKQQIAK